MTDKINDIDQRWNNEGELWNEDNPPPKTRRFLRPLPAENEIFGVQAERQKVIHDWNRETDQPVVAKEDLPPKHTHFTGNFAALRAMRVAHQHRINFWGEEGPIRLFTSSDVPDPSQAQLDQQYQDLQLFSYLPDSMLPTRRQFEDLARPQRRAAVTQARLADAGVTTGAQDQTDDTTDARLVISSQQPLLPASVPFSGNLADFCAERIREQINA